jgi:membrane-bound lytic murein transglycosylase D
MGKTFVLLLSLIMAVQVHAGTADLLQRELGAGSDRHAADPYGTDRHLARMLELAPADHHGLPETVSGLAEPESFLLDGQLPDSDIPLALNGKVNYFIDYFQGRGRSSFARWLSRSERYIPMMKEVLRREGLPEDLVYLAMIESGFTPHAISVASAVGPWQFMSGTGKRYDLRINDWIDERRDPLKSTVAAALYLKELYALFNNDWYLAAAGYNAGENKILRAISKYDTRDFWEMSKGSYLKRETKDYVPKLLAAAIIAKEPARYGFADIAYLPAMDLDTVQVPSRTDLDLIARITDVPVQTLRELNPELRRWCPPPDYPNYLLKLPKGKKATFDTEYAKVPADQRFTERIVHRRYTVRRKETLATIAARFNTTPEALRELNGLGSRTKLKGRSILVPVQATPPPETPVITSVTPGTEPANPPDEVTRYYTVKRGDTLYSLAKRFKVTTAILAAWNNLTEKVALKPGKRIIVAKRSAGDRG